MVFMNTYSNLLKKENILFQQNPITTSSSPFRLVFLPKEKYRFFFVGKKLENKRSTSRSNKYSIICSATKKQTNHLNDNSKLNNSFTLKQKNKVDYKFQIYNSTKSATFSETNIQKEKKNYNLNFLKKLNCFNFLLKKNATNKWVNWVNDVNFESFNKIGSSAYHYSAFALPRFGKAEAKAKTKELKKAELIASQPLLSLPRSSSASLPQSGGERHDLQVQRSGEENPLNKNLYKTGYSKIHELKLVSVEIASPEKIKEWAEKVLPNGKVFGEVTNANTLHYKTFKPHKGGLFCERIFGPLKDFECACGVRSKPMELESYLNENQQKKRFFCMNCDVEYTWSVIRRYQLGYINLISPVSHIWFLKANPSYLSLLLDLRRSHLESIIYCTEAITLENLWKSAQTLGLDTSPSTLYSIWQKLLEEEKSIKRKHKEIKKMESFLSPHSMPSALSLKLSGSAPLSSVPAALSLPLSLPSSAKPSLRERLRFFREANEAEPKEPKPKEPKEPKAKQKSLCLSGSLLQQKRLNLMYLYIKNKDLFYKKNIMSDYIQNYFYKNKILSNNQFYNYEKSYEKNLKLMYKKTFFQVVGEAKAFTNNTFLFSSALSLPLASVLSASPSEEAKEEPKRARSSQKILFFKDLINKLNIYNSLAPHSMEKNFVLSSALLKSKISSLFGIYYYSHNNKLQKENKKIKNLHLKKQIISNIYEKEIVQFKDNFLVLAESFFQIYFTKLYLKDKNFIMQIPNNILQLFCEFFLFYCIQIQLNFYIKKNPLNNLPKIFSNNKKKISTYNKNNQIFSLKKIKAGNNKILKVSSKIKKGIHSTTGLFYYTGICLFKKQIKLNMFFQKNKKFHLNFPYNKEITYKINFNKKNNLFENVKLSLNLIESFNKYSSISISKSFIPNVQNKKQANLLQILIQEIHHKNNILSIQKNRKNLSDILYVLYQFYKKEMVSYKETSEIKYKQDKKFSILMDIYSLSTFLNLFYIKNNKYKFSEIINFNNLINYLYKISSNKKYKLFHLGSSLASFTPSALSLHFFRSQPLRESEGEAEANEAEPKEAEDLPKPREPQRKLLLSLRPSHFGSFGSALPKRKRVGKAEEGSERAERNKRSETEDMMQKDQILKIQSGNVINLTKNCSYLNLNKKNTLNQRKKFLFLQKQKSLILRNPQFFSSIYFKKTANNIYTEQYSQSPKARQYKEDWPSSSLPLLHIGSFAPFGSRKHVGFAEEGTEAKGSEAELLLSLPRRGSALPSERSEQKKILKNDLYTISYSHLWPLNADWKSFFYYNSAPKDFEDTHIYYSYRKGSFYNKSNKFSTKLDIVSQIDEIFVSDSMNNDPSLLGSFASFASSSPKRSKRVHGTEEGAKEANRVRSSSGEQRSKTKVTKTTEFLSKMNSPVAGAAIIKKLLSEYTPSELKKMVKQHQVLLPKLTQNIRKLKEKAIKKLDFVKIQKLLNKRDHIIRRLKLIRKFSRKNVEPTSMILSVLPVLPPDLRPILKLQNQIAASDLNRLYQRIIYRNERLKKFLKDPSTSQSFEMKYAQRLLQEAVDNLIQNGKGNVKPETNSRGQALKSLSEILKGKQGRFRQYLLGKRVDYSGRSVIVVGPKLKLYECGLPKEMAIELFLPFLIKRILHYKIARTVIGAKNFLYSNKTYCINLLNEIMRNHPVLLNRAPTLHRLGIQAFQPKLVEGRAILLHPLVCPAFNADFDGDQMAVHLPITVEARAEAWTLIFSRNHLISPATGDPIVLPSQDMVLGCYYLTSEKKNISATRSQISTFKLSDQLPLAKLKELKQSEKPSPPLRGSEAEPLYGSESEELSSKRSERSEAEHNNNFINSPNKLETNENLNINDKKYKNFFCISNLFNLEKVLNAYQLGKISVQSIVWIKWNGKTQFANEPLSMIEIRLNRYGIRDQIHSKFYKRIDKKENLLNQYIQTTPGRILINNITQKCMFL
uniref:DNA-directed RNA polymerase subunit beta' n=1 Tax=Pediastrum duplex TaxID=3105 RepID=A0A2U8GHZ5_PEDDU|nr:beta subunit of RNA polymerase [Pediastrum duplex]